MHSVYRDRRKGQNATVPIKVSIPFRNGGKIEERWVTYRFVLSDAVIFKFLSPFHRSYQKNLFLRGKYFNIGPISDEVENILKGREGLLLVKWHFKTLDNAYIHASSEIIVLVMPETIPYAHNYTAWTVDNVE